MVQSGFGLDRLFALPRSQKRGLQVTTDAVLIVASFALAMLLRLDSWEFAERPRTWLAIALVAPLTIALFVRLGFYRSVVRYIGAKAVRTILAGVLMSAFILLFVSQLFGLPVPRSVPFIYALLLFLTVGGIRFALRALYQSSLSRRKKRVLIYGAGATGRQLAVSLQQGPEYAPVAFADDAADLQGNVIEGMRVHPPARIEQLVSDYGIETILLAMPSATRARRAEILRRLEPMPIPVRTVPAFEDLVEGRARLGEIREIAVEDLLGRDPVPPRADLLEANIRDRVVLVSGAGGSIGSELCRQILRLGPRRLLLVEVSEFALYTIDRELQESRRRLGVDVDVVPLLGSVQNPGRMKAILRRFAVDTVYHAAAYKHVPLVEHNVVEGLRNNVFGTLTLAEAAVAEGVASFILVSTDKAVRPTNIMGASKRLAELICQAMAARQDRTVFSMVRFGNVLGSSGSVIPLFRAQIAAGGPVTVTHPEITRFFMTIPEAAQLVIQAGAMARGGDVFVLDMGEPVRIADLAARLVRLSGLQPIVGKVGPVPEKGQIPIVYTRLRPGEKLYEELLIGDSVAGTEHPRIHTAVERALEWEQLEALLARLMDLCQSHDIAAIRALLVEAQTGYAPREDIVDPVGADDEELPAAAPVAFGRPGLTILEGGGRIRRAVAEGRSDLAH